MENRPSGLKQPSRLPALGGGGGFGFGGTARPLHETSSSDLNMRNASNNGSLMHSATIIPSKHKVSGLPEPPTKRKTLAERAGEPVQTHTSHKPSITNGFGTRPKTSHASYREPFGTSNAIARPASRQATGIRGLGGQRTQLSASVQAQSQAQCDDQDSDAESAARRKGTTLLSFNTSDTITTLHVRKVRTHSNLRQQHDSVQSQSAGDAESQHSGLNMSSYRDSSSGDSPRTSRTSSKSSMSSVPSHRHHNLGGPVGASQPSREVSLSTVFADLAITPHNRTSSKHRPSLESILEEKSPSKIPKFACAPNTSLRHVQSAQTLHTPSPIKVQAPIDGLRTPLSAAKSRKPVPIFLTKEKLTPVIAWDTSGRLDDMERMFNQLKGDIVKANDSKTTIEETLEIYKARVQELTNEHREISSQYKAQTSELERARSELHMTSTDLRQVRRDQERELNDVEKKYDREVSDLKLKQEREAIRLEREREKETNGFAKKMEEAKKMWEKARDEETADLTSQHWEEMDQLRSDRNKTIANLRAELDGLREAGESRATESATEVQLLRDTIASNQNQLDASNATVASLRSRITTYESRVSTLEQEKNSLVSKTHFLEGNQEAQSHEFTHMQQKMEEAIAEADATRDTLRKEEMLRRKLNATILELRGNIRVFVRTRPLLDGEDNPAKVDYIGEDSLEGCKEMVVHAPTTQSVTGKTRDENHKYEFDRVFTPGTPNTTVFVECRDLIQSVVDGYNVSILSYGQTGSGKTYGMTGPEGIIPSSISMLMAEMGRLKEKGWDYAVEANFVEVYNETLNDLLGNAKTWDETEDLGASTRGKKKEKHEIHRDPLTGKTTVTNLKCIGLWPPPQDGSWPPAAPVDSNENNNYTEKAVANLLETAAKNRRVAATKSNERSSRSHSIFILTLKGSCAATGESSEGVLNLVDLAGSERLKQSGAEGSRMKETQAINKSLSSLGDVIAALGNKRSDGSENHVPYRNSTLTWLLQSSLGGTVAGKSSRTLMLLHLSPLQQHWSESKSSLVFGSKVHGTHIGTAKKR